ncbi:hypothetical protein [Mesorhizobium sp.]|uniref:hypothetical protein n=1 Tax=Mesorhizobium sp. TaxID=1871066 RepID=UPI000FE39E90|nr:hypothetical protein [Mesorhizobium sp.]RWA62879.1 MAG: hypothetical protein EOQ28_30925 [Mesorhizobium sp.]RWB94866.1 MAG: hypothetical protein EOQ57_30830 [Mesorhizobium sp.]RWG82236.1 MAG: hypothetical protein EOQ69_16200 [Mesorhizobium sp.]RWG86915.1 MAG: hypothetical protein EOQ70_14415 [Mesorhizobium sp.]RWJ98068.1 MAG: hypothetical protein EOR42_27825 [Mesorhizobium sp.]
MSVVAILLHLSRAIIHAQNNAKVRNLMDGSAPNVRNDTRRQIPRGATENEPSRRPSRYGGR